MEQREFNLLDENWVIAMREDGSTEKLSLIGVLDHAAELKCLAGEMPTQDVAILRLLLAVLHVVVARYDPDGNEVPLTSQSKALERWQLIYNRGRLPMGAIRAYIERYRDRFWLFDPEQPFMQAPIVGRGTKYEVSKLNGEISESSNKIRLFPQRTGAEKNSLDYDESARWLVCINAFDDSSVKKDKSNKEQPATDTTQETKQEKIENTTEDKPRPGVGWLGKLGLIMAEGDSLFETLMLNLVLVPNTDKGRMDNGTWVDEKPLWERAVETAERRLVKSPDNLSQLYTFQSRRPLLTREGKRVVRFRILSADFFCKDDNHVEQMTLWERVGDTDKFTPRQHDPSRQLWRDFSAILARSNTTAKTPGIIEWLSRLCRKSLIKKSKLCLKTVGVKYGDKSSSVAEIFEDSMTFAAGFLTEEGEYWIPGIVDELATTDQLVSQLGYLAQCVAKAAGDSDGQAERTIARENAYFRLDIPFREWLESIDTENDEMSDRANGWFETARSIVRSMGAEIIKDAGPRALVGRTVVEKQREVSYRAPEAYNRFLYITSTRDALKKSIAKGGKNNG